MNIDTNGINLEDTVIDRITGLKGKATAFAQFVTGCARVQIQPPIDKDGKVPETVWCDVLTVEVGVESFAQTAPAKTGGPQRGEPRSRV